MPSKATSKPAGKQAVKAGPSGKMHKFESTGTQKPQQTAQMGRGGGKFAKGGPSGKMQKFQGTTAVTPGKTSVR
jgi:hypothetical protein